MSTHTMTRRGFIGVTAAVAGAAACAGGIGAACAHAEQSNDGAQAAYQVHTLCDGCANECGMIAWMRDGKLWRCGGEEGHPTSAGYLCGRGQGLARQAYSTERLTKPLKNNGDGKFTEVSWDEALSDISDHVSGLGEKLAVLQARGNCEPFVRRLAASLGTPNYFTNAAAVDTDSKAAFAACLGGADPVPDIAHTKFALVIGKSSFDGVRPAWQAAIASGDTEVVLVDARQGSFGRAASRWVPIIPGTELAFLMAIAYELIRTGAYDRSFVAKHTSGFEELVKSLKGCTPAWASQICGIGDGVISAIASKLANSAPAAFVDYPRQGSFGAAYKNSFDTCRMVCVVNALLGSYNREGGWIVGKSPEVSDAKLATLGIPAPAKVAASPAGADVVTCAETSCMAAIQAMQTSDITAALLIQTNPVIDYPAAGIVKDSLQRLQFLVVADEFMTDTAQLADYVLPLASYLECGNCAHVVSATTSTAALRSPAVERMSDETKSVDELVQALANACGKHDALAFTLEDYNRAWCKIVGVDYDGLLAEGTSAIPTSSMRYGALPALKTKSGKVELAPKGLGAPTWTEPAYMPTADSPRLMTGQQAVHCASFTADSDQLMEISKMYGLERVWINSDTAAAKGIEDNDTVKISIDNGSITARAKVTKCICPSAVWMPVHYGVTSPQVSEAAGFGSNPLGLVGLSLEPKTGAAMVGEVLATVEKAGA